MYLGVRVVLAKSFARIHIANLINAGILPVTFENESDYNDLQPDEGITFSNIVEGMKVGRLDVKTDLGKRFTVCCDLTVRQQAILLAGGLLNYTREGGL